MNKHKINKSQQGITLIALVISIIVMLILAGVSLNATVGENGILTQAQEAAKAQKLAAELEALQMAVAGHSVKAFINEKTSTDALIEDLMHQELIDWVDTLKDDSGNSIDNNYYEDENGHKYIWVKKGDNSYRIFLDENGTYSVDRMPLSGGGTLVGGTHVVTQDAFANGEGVTDPNERGKFTIEGDTKVIFNEPLGVGSDGITANGDMLSIYVKSGARVQVYFNASDSKKASDGKTYYKLTNSGLSRSAIDIEQGGELKIVVAEGVVLSVDSGFSTRGATGNMGQMKQNEGGQGGFAGIHVPEGAILNLYGKGTMYAYGGNASAGGAGTSDSISQSHGGNGGGGGGGAGAGIGGNGGNGGESNSTCDVSDEYNLWGHSYTDAGHDGYSGENCGNVNIYNSLKVYAYGGAGSNTVPSLNFGTNSGGSGYPAAGIGGGGAGGAGGDWAGGAGGYVGTWGDHGDNYRTNGNNGISLLRSDFNDAFIANGKAGQVPRGTGDDAASYFTPGTMNSDQYSSRTNMKITVPCVGGQGAVFYGSNGYFPSGSGGKAGNGGTVRVSANAMVYAYNGDRITNGDYSTSIYDYDKDGNKLETTCYVLDKHGTSNKISPLKIFAQAGTLRKVYYTNLDWGRKSTTGYEYFQSILGDQVEESVRDVVRPTNYNEVANNLIRAERTISLTGYINPETNDCYGIGSGAGYMEVSNGIYTRTEELN